MHDQPLPKRIYYRYLGYLYWFTHYTTTHRLLGIRLSSIIKLLAIFLALAAWRFNWGDIPLALALLLTVWIYIAYWRAKRCGYYRFVADRSLQTSAGDHKRLAPYQRIACLATGIFSLQEWEENVLFCPADYWQVPRGDHALMVEHQPRKYLYQFFSVAKIIELQRGWLLYGARPNPALSINYLSIWGPEFSKIHFSIFGAEVQSSGPKSRTIYLSFTNDEAEQIVCQNIAGDFQRFKSEEQAV